MFSTCTTSSITCSNVGCWLSFIVDILRADVDDTGAPATRRGLKADVVCALTDEDVLATLVDAGDTTNPSVVAARARKAATATDFMLVAAARGERMFMGDAEHACKETATHVSIYLIGVLEN